MSKELCKDRETTFGELYDKEVVEEYWMNDRYDNIYKIQLYQFVSKEDGSCNSWRFEEWVNDVLKIMANYPNNRDVAYNHFFARRDELDSYPNMKTRSYFINTPNITTEQAVAYVEKVIEDVRGKNDDPTE